MPTKRNVSAGVKKNVAARQRFSCAANVPDYPCPLKGEPFDEAGYDIDHIVPLSEGGTNDPSNLQALCVMCHRVKSNRASIGSKPVKTPVKKKEWNVRNTEIGYLYESSSSDDDFKEVVVNGKKLSILQRTH